MKLSIYYHKPSVKSGRPIFVSNGKSEIQTNCVILEGIQGKVTFNSTRGPGLHLGQARRHGTTTPLEIDILPDYDDIEKIRTPNKTKALIERKRYRKNNPEVKRHRKEDSE